MKLQDIRDKGIDLIKKHPLISGAVLAAGIGWEAYVYQNYQWAMNGNVQVCGVSGDSIIDANRIAFQDLVKKIASKSCH